LAKDAKPDMKLSPSAPEIGFIHRKLPTGDLYFVANTSNETKSVRAVFRDAAKHGEFWDAFSGESKALPDTQEVDLDLEAYGSRLIFFSDATASAKPEPARRESVQANL